MKHKTILRKLLVISITFVALNACTRTTSIMIPTISFTSTIAPTITLQPTSKPTLTPEPTTETSIIERTACDHPYFPLRSGNSWTETYAPGFSVTRTVKKVIGDLHTASAEINNITESGDALTTYFCNQDGISPAMRKNDSYKGVFLPSAKLLDPGYSWNFSTVLKDNAGKVLMDSSFSCSVIGIEKVEWNEKNVDALKIECQVNRISSNNAHDEYSITSFFLEDVGEISWNASEGSQMEVTEYQIN